MTRPLAGCLLLVAFVAAFVAAQEGSSKKGDEPRKTNTTAKKDDAPRDELPNIPAGGKVWLSSERVKEIEDRYQKLLDQFNLLERQIKNEKLLPSACKLTGRLEGEIVVLKAEVLFATSAPDSKVFIGLKNGFLVDEGQIDDGVPHLEATDDGYFVRVAKEGSHRLTLNVRTPVAVKRTMPAGTTGERGFDLGLPGSAVTTLAIDVPQTFKELRCNDIAATSRRPGHWDATLGAQKSLAVVWKEPATTPSAAIGPSARATIKVKLVEGRVEIVGDLVLEDAKAALRDWHLLLPPQVKVSPAPGSAAFAWLPPDGKTNTHLIRVTEPAERVTLLLQAQYARTQSQQKLPIGPFLAQEAPTHGTILIQSTPGVLRGQRLLYQRFGEVFQRDPPKGSLGLENIAQFQFWNASFTAKPLSPSKAPLELEWKAEKGQIDSACDHEVKVRDDRGQWFIDVESKFHVQSANSGLDTIEMQMPALTFPDLLWLGVQPSLGFPSALSWPVALTPRPAFPSNIIVTDDSGALELPVPDAQQHVRLKLSRPIGNEIVVKVQSRYVGPSDINRFVIELPKLIGTLDRGAKVTVWTPPGQEFLVGPAEQPEPIHEKLQQTYEQMPATLDLAWRGSQRERLAKTVVDLIVRDQSIQVKQTLLLPAASWSGGATQTGQIALRLPAPGFAFAAVNVPRLSQDKTLAWIKLPPENKGHYEIELAYDISRDPKKSDAAVAIPLLWPENTTGRDAKLRVWTEPGIAPTLQGLGEIWRERPLEEGSIPGAWPSLVADGMGANLPVAIQFEQSAGHRLPVMVAERSLIQVRVEEDGTQIYRCRYLVRKFSGSSLDVELPVAWEQGQPHFRIGGREAGGIRVIDPLQNRVRVPLATNLYPQPVLFEIDYQIPASLVDGKRFWHTPLTPPRIVGDAVFGLARWQLGLPDQQISFILGSNSSDRHWALKGWLLTPEPSETSADLEAWIGEPVASDLETVSLSWWRNTIDNQRVYHFPRQAWLVFWSGIVLVLGLLIVTALPRLAIAAIAIAIGLAVVALGLFHENVLPVIFLGCQPGLAVFIAVAGAHALLQERSRRQAQYVPSFSRIPVGSTVVRNQPKPLKSPSTIDAPVAGPGSVKNAAN